jgi:lipoic acid synthetase
VCKVRDENGVIVQLAAMRDLRGSNVDILTLGQYLRPAPKHLPIARYVPAAEFDEFRRAGYAMGFEHVESGPLVRSSYRASDHASHASHAFSGEPRRC